MRVAGEDSIAALGRQRCLDPLVDPEIEHRVQHARHADGGAGANGQQQGAFVRAETATGLDLQHGDASVKLVDEAVRQRALGEIGAAGLGVTTKGAAPQALAAHAVDAHALPPISARGLRRAVEGEHPAADSTHAYSCRVRPRIRSRSS